MKTYVLTVSEFFPKTHNKSGLPTGFINAIGNKTKIHTIRGNYPLWKKRIEEIQKGNAVLSIRYWTGKPYNSKQKEVYVLDKDSGIGCVEVRFDGIMSPWMYSEKITNGEPWDFSTKTLAANDGLSLDDFKEWFKGYDLNEPMAIIHFTDFRY
jgi:hypothetical protein